MFLLIIVLVYKSRKNKNAVGYEAFVPGNVWQENKACALVFISFNPVEIFFKHV